MIYYSVLTVEYILLRDMLLSKDRYCSLCIEPMLHFQSVTYLYLLFLRLLAKVTL